MMVRIIENILHCICLIVNVGKLTTLDQRERRERQRDTAPEDLSTYLNILPL